MLQAIFDKVNKKKRGPSPNAQRRASLCPPTPDMSIQRRASSNSLLTPHGSHGSPHGSKPCSRRGSMNSLRHDSTRAQSRWKTLATTLKRIKGSDRDHQEEVQKSQPFRFPAFGVIDIRPDIAPSNVMDRLWLRVTAPDDSNVDVKVN